MGATPHKAVTYRFPQEGGNRTLEAPGVVFDPITGGGGMETPLPNDSLKASLSPPVGGRLRSFRRDWQTNKCSSNVLNIITNGYVLPFLSKPNLVRFPLILSEYKARQKDQPLATCIQSLLSKNAGMPWFWDLVQLSTEIPLQLPVSTTLLTQSHNYVFHSNPQHLNLHAWCLGVDSSKNKASLWRWQRELLHPRGHQQEPSTSQSGPYLRNGVEKIRWTSPFQSQSFSCTCTKT